jgi:Fe-S cluster assembly protein SufD
MSEATLNRPHTPYIADLDAEYTNGQPDWFKAIRNAGRAAFEATTFPHTKMEEWRHTNLGVLAGTHYAPSLPDASEALSRADIAPFSFAGDGFHELVFVDGHFAKALSSPGTLPDGALLGSIRSHLDDDTLRAHLNQHAQNRNAYTALNTASLKDGALVHVPRNTVLDAPVHLLFVSTGAAGGRAAHIRTVIALGESSEAQIITSYAAMDAGADYLANVVEEIALAPNAQLKYYKLVREGAAGNHLATTEVDQDRDSRFSSLVISQEGRITRNQLCVKLAGSGAECALHGLYMNDGDRLIDNAINIHHAVPHCNSRIAYKGILDGNSRSVFTGKVNVDRVAQKTDSNQLSNNLLLSDGATIDAKPQLEIYADDVKCTHGATVGAHPDPIIFYFRSRGIDEATARGMLTYGFADEIVSEIGPEPLRARQEAYVFTKYSPKQ